MPRFFTLLEAERLLPEVDRLLRSCMQGKEDYGRAEAELTALTQRVNLSGGMMVSRDKVLQIRHRKEASVNVLQSTVKAIEDIGCLVKDMEMGLVDFPTMYRGKEVYLCWKLGESGIQFWHPVEEGFGGRRLVDSDFLSNHRGDSA